MSVRGEDLRRLLELAVGPITAEPDLERSAPPAGELGSPRTLTVGVVTHGEFQATYLTVNALRLGCSDVLDHITFLVVDTDPLGSHGWALKALEWDIPDLRYLPAGEATGPNEARERVFQETNSDWVLCLDSGVLLAPEALTKLLAYVERHPECGDLLQGPQLHDDMAGVSTHWAPAWKDGRFGVADCDDRGVDPGGAPFEIPLHSLGLFVCRREAWLGFNPRFSGAAMGEGYLHHKFRVAGRRALCLPFLRWVQRSDNGTGTAYPSDWEGRIRGYLIGWDELELPVEPILEHFRGHLGRDAADIAWARWTSEKANPFLSFDGIFCINLDSRPDRWERMRQRFEALGIADRVRRISGTPTKSSHVGCTLAHRKAIELAHREDLENVLVFEDDVVFLDGATWVLRRGLRELARRSWDLLYLGSHRTEPFPLVKGCRHLEVANGRIYGAHALVYRRAIYQQILDDLPSSIDEMTDFAPTLPIDVYLSGAIQDGVFRISPMVAAQENLLPDMPPDLRDQYVVSTAPTS